MPLRLPTRKANKYRAQKTHLDGIVFASKREAQRYGKLRLLEQAGEISELGLQPQYPVTINGVHCFTYKADFSYKTKDGETVVEDSKGYRNRIYALKVKCVKAFYGIDVREV